MDRGTPKTARILVVDDDENVAAALAEMLRLDGHQVDIAINGNAALEQLREGAYDVILSDMRMPGLDGPGLYRELQLQHPALARRFIAYSGDMHHPSVQTFLEQTGVPRMVKPFTLAQVRCAVTNLAWT
jgi:DNA-binding NtrC family response regulator